MPEKISSTFNVPVDKLLEDAEDTGTLVLSGRKMSIFPPTAASYDLSDVIEVDLSQNRFVQLPESMNTMMSLEKLLCFNNVLRQVPELTALRSLVHLDLGRNHLTQIPAHLCKLPLKELIISHNRLVSLPDEIGNLSSLMDLDCSGNEIVALPESIGHLVNLRDLNVRRNHLVALPNSLTSLRLVRLDISVNRIVQLPLSFIKLTSLMTLILHDNPLTLPPSNVCIRGRVHIFKYLKEEIEKSKDDGSVSSQRSIRREQRSRLRRGARNSPMRPEAQSPTPRMSRSLEEEMENVASKHGLDWSSKKTATANKHDYAILEPLPLKDTDDDLTPKSSPTRTAAPLDDLKATESKTTRWVDKPPPRSEIPPPSEVIAKPPLSTKPPSPVIRRSPSSQRKPNGTASKAIPRPVSTSALPDRTGKTPPSRRAASTKAKGSPGTTRPVSGTGVPKPKLAAKPSAQEVAAKTAGTKKRLELEWMEKQKEQQKLARERQLELVTKRQAAEREQYQRNRLQNARRISQPTTPTSTGSAEDKFEKARQEQEEIMAAAEASRKAFQQREKADTISRRQPTDSPDHQLKDPQLASSETMSKSSSREFNIPKSSEYLEKAPQIQTKGMDRQYTVKRHEREVKKEFATMDSLRKLLENALQQDLPADLMVALSDGVVLCNLVNQLRPNTISVIYTPPHRERAGGAGTTKLSMLKSVKNVDAFILGCKKTGLDSGLVCSPADVLEMKDPLHVYITVRALVNRCSEAKDDGQPAVV